MNFVSMVTRTVLARHFPNNCLISKYNCKFLLFFKYKDEHYDNMRLKNQI